MDNRRAYEAKIRRSTATPCRPERCPKCGKQVGLAVTVAGKRYLAEIVAGEAEGVWYAKKGQPHFVNCAGAPSDPSTVVKGSRVVVARGRAVPKGTTGVVFWMGSGQYGERVGIKDDAGVTYWTALANVDVVKA